MKGAVFFDYDGTLVDEKANIYTPSQKTIQAISLLQKNGFAAGICTGRSLCYLPPTSIPFDFFITTNGAYIKADQKELKSDTIDPIKVQELISFMEKENMVYAAETQEKCYTNGLKTSILLDMLQKFKIPLDNFLPYEKDKQHSIYKFMVFFQEEKQYALLCSLFQDFFEITRTNGVNSCDVCKKGINKAKGLEEILSFYHIKKENTYAFGDGENDYQLLKCAGQGILMGYHAKKLEELSLPVTKTVTEEGVYYGVTQFILKNNRTFTA